ncbi:MAG: DUF4340 domain-containing protein [Lachnospiraceae bacterium]|jgi:hypothetical protein|nr:DUF4340 domain-containing protein [Lachnospiraceae bacterium]
MAKRKKRNAFTLVSLLFVMVLLIGFYIWNGKRKKASDAEKEDSKAEENITVASIDSEQVKTVHYIGKDADITLTLIDGETWISEAEPERPINQQYVKNMVNQVKKVDARRILSENAENLAEYGLDHPKAYLQVTLQDNSTLTLQIGDESSGISGCYALVNEDNKVYLLNSTYRTGLDFSDLDFTAVEDGPDITAAGIDFIQVLKRDGEDFELLNDKDNKYKQTSKMYPWVITKPYEEGYAADSSKISDLQANYSSFDFVNCVDYSGKDLARYGLEDPAASIYIKYFETHTETLEEPETDPETGEEIKEKTTYEDKEYRIYVGNQEEDGNYYVRREGSDYVYTMRKTDISKMLETDPFELMSKFICIPSIDTVDRIDIDINGTAYTMEIKRETLTDEEGKEETQASYYYNGSKVEEDAFKEVYKKMIAVGYDAKAEEKVNTVGIKPTMTIRYHIVGEGETTLTASFLPYDDSFYLVDTGHTIRFFADKRQVDDVAKAVKELIP